MTSAEKPALRFLDFNDPENGILAYCLGNGKLVDSDLHPIWDVFDSAKKTGKKIRIYCEIDTIPSVSATVIFDKFKRIGTLLSTIERMAIVGDQAWLDFYARIVNPVTGFEVRSFASGNAGSAKQWVLSNKVSSDKKT